MSEDEGAETQKLLEHIQGDNPRAIIEAARELASRGEPAAAPRLRQVLASTEDPLVRNALALALSDMKDPPAFDALLDLIKSARTEGKRGTLLYALGAYDCSTALPVLVDVVIHGNFEESNQALSLINEIETELDEATWRECNQQLRSALPLASDERRPLLEKLIELFERE